MNKNILSIKDIRVALVSLLLGLVALASLGWTISSRMHSAQAAGTWPSLKQGSNGENVVTMQYMLRARGYNISVDGDFGTGTASAVKSFQSDQGVEADGEVGSQTWAALVMEVKPGDKGVMVIALQRQLKQAGASMTVDGNFGATTSSALKSYQSKHKIATTGIAGAQTWQSLVSDDGSGTAGTGGGNSTIVSIARSIEKGNAVKGWSGGAVPYSWGGGHGDRPGPSTGTCDGYTGSIHPCPATHTVGADCSGFTRWVYSLAYGSDVLGAGNTNDQVQHLTRVSSPRPGDLVFFGSSSSNTHHVGIYIGNGQMINALKTGTDVKTDNVSRLSDLVGYYRYN